MTLLPDDPRVELIFTLWLAAYSIIGVAFWDAFRDEHPSLVWKWLFALLGGPAVTALAIYHVLAGLRRRILGHWGMENWTCCSSGRACGRHAIPLDTAH